MADPTVIINLEPDWGYTPEISYAFETVIQPTPYFVEQRRPLLPTPIRTQGCRYAFSGNSLQYARNLFLYGLSKLCCVPIYSEPIFSAAVTQGATSITATTDLTYLWNIKNSDWLILLDFVSGQSEMLGIASVSGQVINLSSAIINSWTASRTIIFPAFAGTISKVKGMDTTDRVGRVDVEFEEQPIGEGSTKVWVGLDEQICPENPVWRPLMINDYNFNWVESTPPSSGTDHGPAYLAYTPYRYYLGDSGSDGRVDAIFYPLGRHIIEFDFYHHDHPSLDYWIDDDYTDAQVFVCFIGTGFAYHTMLWHYNMPYYSPGVAEAYGFNGPQLRMYLHKLTTAKISVRTLPSGAFAADAAITGLRTGAADFNTYRFEVNFSTHTVSGYVNGVQFISDAPFSSEADASFVNGFHMILHSHKYSYGDVYFKNIRVY